MSELLTPEQIGEKTSVVKAAGDDLLGQAQRAEISNPEILAQAGDLYKVINTQLKKSEEARKALTKPLKDHCKWIEKQFKETEQPLNDAKVVLKTKMDDYVALEAKAQEEANRKAREQAEAEALEAAAKHEASGDTETAEAVVEAAADLPDVVQKTPIARGNLGASTSTRTDWKARIVDSKAFFQAIADGDIPEEFVTINQSKLDDLAKSRKVEKTNLGIEVYKKVSASVR